MRLFAFILLAIIALAPADARAQISMEKRMASRTAQVMEKAQAWAEKPESGVPASRYTIVGAVYDGPTNTWNVTLRKNDDGNSDPVGMALPGHIILHSNIDDTTFRCEGCVPAEPPKPAGETPASPETSPAPPDSAPPAGSE